VIFNRHAWILRIANNVVYVNFDHRKQTISPERPIPSQIHKKEENMEYDYAFEMAASNIRFGPGTTREVGMDLSELGLKRVMVVTDPNLTGMPPVKTVLESLSLENVSYSLFDRVRIEPTDSSLKEAIEFARSDLFDGFVAVGGGSTIDTAKVANLYATYPADFLDYVNPPIGKGIPIPGELKPLFAIPTTAGTGSETTGVAIFDLEKMHAKTGIAHRRLKPTLGIVDPENTRTLPPMAAACTGLDVFTHAIESYTALPFDRRPRPERPIMRPAYQGSNPVSDIWSLEAMRMGAAYLVRAVEDPSDDEARGMMLLAASFAGVGFGNAGVTLPHGMSYPVSGMVREYRAEGYPDDHPMVPHGMAVVLNAPAAFRFTGSACTERHLKAAEVLGADVSGVRPEDAGSILADRVIQIMKRLNIPNGLSAIGYSREDIPQLVEGTLPQHRVIKLSPRPAGPEELTQIFEDAMVYW
jgi:hydroxyacid-oxoacid transhydrogenase